MGLGTLSRVIEVEWLDLGEFVQNRSIWSLSIQAEEDLLEENEEFYEEDDFMDEENLVKGQSEQILLFKLKTFYHNELSKC